MVSRRSFLSRGLAALSFTQFESRVMREVGVASPTDLTSQPRSHFVVVEVGFEFNDELNYAAMDQAGFPRQVFATQAAAEAVARQLNHDTLRGLDLTEYCNDPAEIWEGDDLAGELASIFGKRYDPSGLTIPSDATDEELDRLPGGLFLTLHYVQETSASASNAT